MRAKAKVTRENGDEEIVDGTWFGDNWNPDIPILSEMPNVVVAIEIVHPIYGTVLILQQGLHGENTQNNTLQ